MFMICALCSTEVLPSGRHVVVEVRLPDRPVALLCSRWCAIHWLLASVSRDLADRQPIVADAAAAGRLVEGWATPAPRPPPTATSYCTAEHPVGDRLQPCGGRLELARICVACGRRSYWTPQV